MLKSLNLHTCGIHLHIFMVDEVEDSIKEAVSLKSEFQEY